MSEPRPHRLVQERIEAARREGRRFIGSSALLSRRDRTALGISTDDWSRASTFCRWCGTSPVPVGRRTWCGQACVTAYRIRSDAAYVRTLVERRDRGICALCGINCTEVENLWRLCRRLYRAQGLPWHTEENRRAWGSWWTRNHALWEADHIVPAFEGGGVCGLENYRTLCLPCHKAETAKLAKRVGAARAAKNERVRLLERRRQELRSGQQQLFMEESA